MSKARTIDLGDGASTTLEQWGDSGPALLCVHGISSSRKSWARTAAALAGHVRLYAYDQRGHGDSAAVSGPMTHARSVRDLLAVERAIDGGADVLLGHSWGGTIVLRAGRESACRGVIAVDPLIRAERGAWAADFVDDLVPVLAEPAVTRESAIQAMFAGLPPIEIAAKVHAMRHMTIGPIVALGAENGADAGDWDLRDVVRGYPKPLLLMLADPSESVVLPPEVEFVRENGGANVTVDVFEGAGHTLHRTEFERFVSSVLSFSRSR